MLNKTLVNLTKLPDTLKSENFICENMKLLNLMFH